MRNLTPTFKIAFVLLLIYVTHLSYLAMVLPSEVFHPLFAETGPYEGMSIVLWCVLGVMLLGSLSLSPRPIAAMALTAFVFAAREADWHKKFTDMSLVKIKFYLSPDVPGMQKLLGGLVYIAVILLLVYLAKLLFDYVYRQGGLRTAIGQLLLLPAVLLPASKILDRIASQVYEITGTRLPEGVGQMIAAWEEGLEMALPVLFIVALLLYRTQVGARNSTATQ